jgi:hypothetical protein
MPESSAPIIATGPLASTGLDRHERFARGCGVALVAWGAAVAWYYYGQGLALSHYDTKGHLVVARRIIDSLTPGWIQVGAVWLPLPHLLNMLPVQIDALYRTGASATAMSVLSFGMGGYAMSRLVLRATGAVPAALLAAALFALNPNVLYLQATPMTEPMLLGLLLLATMGLHAWVFEGSVGHRQVAAWALAAACMTRYEAWPFTAAALAITALGRWMSGLTPSRALRDAAGLGSYTMVAVLLFLVNSRLSVGQWFVTGGFYVPDPALQGQPFVVTGLVAWGVASLGTYALVGAAMVGAAVVLAAAFGRGLRQRGPAPGRPEGSRPSRHVSLLVPFALVAVAALPWYAFFQGHPFRIRYMVPLVVAAIAIVSIAIGLLPARVQRVGALLLLLFVLRAAPPFDSRAAMVTEAQWDRPNSRARQAVAACLTPEYAGDTIMASMGSLAHYMQELSHAGFGIRDFLHEGNGDLWAAALAADPHRHVGWMLIEERAEGGDMLAQRARRDPAFLSGFDRVCEGGGVALYRARHRE